MAELFRFIQHAFVVPSTRQVVDVGRQSDLQDNLGSAVAQGLPPERLRSIASRFIDEHFSSPQADPLQLGKQLRSFTERLVPPFNGAAAIDQLISALFDSDAPGLVASNPFQADKALLDDTLVCVKITTAFDRVDAHRLVTMRQAIAFIEDFAAGNIAGDDTGISESLRRPIRIPGEFVKALPSNADRPPSPPPSDSAIEEAARRRAALLDEQQHLKTAYDRIMALPADQFELRPKPAPRSDRKVPIGRGHVPDAADSGGTGRGLSAPPAFLAIPKTVVERWGDDVSSALEAADIDVVNRSVSDVVAAIKRRWQDVSEQLAPYQAPAPLAVYRIGAHLFAVQESDRAPARIKEAL